MKGFVCKFFALLCCGYHGAAPILYMYVVYSPPFSTYSIPTEECTIVLLHTFIVFLFHDAFNRCPLQGLGNKRTTLYDIRDEMFGPFKDRRHPFFPMPVEERFCLLTGK